MPLLIFSHMNHIQPSHWDMWRSRGFASTTIFWKCCMTPCSGEPEILHPESIFGAPLLEWNNKSVGYSKQCSLAWSRFEGGRLVVMFWEGNFSFSLHVRGRKGGRERGGRSRLGKKGWRWVWEGKMLFADQSRLLVLIRLQWGWVESGHPQLLGILSYSKGWSFPLLVVLVVVVSKMFNTALLLYCFEDVNILPFIGLISFECDY